jgi:hypothetical protein
VSEKPLHVRVAEALGWTDLREEAYVISEKTYTAGEWRGRRGIGTGMHWGRPPRYDTDWSATGSLIERYHIDLWWENTSGDGQWTATTNFRDGGDLIVMGTGPSPLIAVCNLILALKEAGKLEAA